MIAERPEVAEVCIRRDCFRVQFCPELLPGSQKEETPGQGKPGERGRRLGDLIREGIPADTYLVHQSDVGFVPVGRLFAADLDFGALAGFTDLMDARVAVMRQGSYGQEIELEGVPAARLVEFDRFLASFFVKNQGRTPEPEGGGNGGCPGGGQGMISSLALGGPG